MPQANFYWGLRYGAATGQTYKPAVTSGALSSGLTNADFLSVDENGSSLLYTDYPISVPSSGDNYSFEKWLRNYWGFIAGSTNQISNCHFFRDGTLTPSMVDTALAVYAKLQTANSYVDPAGGAANGQRATGAGTQTFFYHNGTSWVGPTAAYTSGTAPTVGTLDVSNIGTKVTFSKYDKASTSWAVSEYGQASATTSNECYWSDYIVMQLKVPSTVSTPGNIVNTGGQTAITWKLQYDEQ